MPMVTSRVMSASETLMHINNIIIAILVHVYCNLCEFLGIHRICFSVGMGSSLQTSDCLRLLESKGEFRELRSAFKAILAFQHHLMEKELKILSDNATTVGETRSLPLNTDIFKIFSWEVVNVPRISAAHIRGEHNTPSDLLNRRDQENGP